MIRNEPVSFASLDAWQTTQGNAVYLAYTKMLNGFVYGIAIPPESAQHLPTSTVVDGVPIEITWQRVNAETAITFQTILNNHPGYAVPKDLLPLPPKKKPTRLSIVNKGKPKHD